ncbi:hypothetical protein ACFE04_024755 [Oxalis oulophora]
MGMMLFIFYMCVIIINIQTSSSIKPTLTVTPNSLTKSTDRVQIQWTGISSPSNLDWLGIYSPPSSRNDHFIGYKFLSQSSPSTWQSGYGSFSLPLTNLRSNYSFRIFHWNQSEINPKKHDHDHNPLPATTHLLAKSEEVGFGSGMTNVPEQIHLAYTERDDEMRVMFVCGDDGERFVRYGVNGNNDDVAVASVDRYEQSMMCDAPANHSLGWRDPGWIFDALMINLKPGVKYFYQVGSDSKGWSDRKSFVSRNSHSDETIAFLFGDMGTATPYSTFYRTQDESLSTVKWILRDIEALGDKPAHISHIGDISYARGFSWVWDEFFTMIEPIASRVPYHVCIGNHEYNWPSQPFMPDWAKGIYGKDGGGECGIPYSLRFHMPGNSSETTRTNSPATRNLYYSLDVGSVHFVYISTETNFLSGSNQYNFIKNDLESVNRTKTPFVVIQGHRPMYTTSNENRDAPMREKMLEHLEPLFVKNKVTLALWGHVHRYERFCPINNFTCGSMGQRADSDWKAFPVHMVIGMAGQDWQPIWTPRKDHQDVPIFPQPEHSMYRGGEFGYTRLVATKEKLTFSYIGNHDGEVHDTVEILASGQVLNGVRDDIAVSKDVNSGGTRKVDVGSGQKAAAGESSFSWYVKVASVLVLGAFGGYCVGYISRSRKESLSGPNWTQVKSEEI